MKYFTALFKLSCKLRTCLIDRSHDGFDTKADGYMDPKAGSIYANQQMVFNELGQNVLSNAYDGKP